MSELEKVDRRTRPVRAFFDRLHQVADRLLTKIEKEFIEAVGSVKKRVDVKGLEKVVENGNVAGVESFLNVDENLKQELLGRMIPVLHGLIVEAARETAALSVLQEKVKKVDVVASLDLTNPAAVEHIREYSFGLIQGITEQTRDGIRQIILDAFERGGPIPTQARRIAKLIGLTQRQAVSVDSFQEMLLQEGKKLAVVERIVNKQITRFIKSRATNIARTETIRASNIGIQLLWEQSKDRGLFDDAVKKIWLLTRDDRTCPICRATAKIADQGSKGIPIEESFQTPIGLVQTPPAHPQCRCTMGLVEIEE